MVLNVEQVVPAVTLEDSNLNVVSGTVNWTTITTPRKDIAGTYSFFLLVLVLTKV